MRVRGHELRRRGAARHRRAAAVVTAWLASLAWADAGQPAPQARPKATAAMVDAAPELDGRVLDDPVWQQAPASDGFWQTTPDAGQPSSERTEVRVIYTATTLYIGVLCHDRMPGAIEASDSRRDSSLDDTDSFQVIFDTFSDGQNGFVFGTNPAGIEYDGQVTREGEGGNSGPGRQQAGAGGGFNVNWDAAWEVRTLVGDFGWSAEFAIPFKTLRYRADADTWTVNFQRNIRRRNEKTYWASLDRQYNIYRLADAGALTGLRVPPQRNLKISPYVLGSTLDQSDTDRDSDFDAGVDAKWSLTPSLTLDLTVNTDFAQVEVDEQQINLDRFNLFFPEKRPFFLENAGLFAVGEPGDVELFFSRRIGIDDDGTPIPIRGGGRLTGKLGGVNVGLLNMQTASVEDFDTTLSANNFTVVRLSRDLPNRSSIGGLFTNRAATGHLAGDDDNGQTYAFDGRAGIGRGGTLQGFVSRTTTPGLSGREHAFGLGGQWQSEGLRLSGSYTEVGNAFNPEVGFLSRDDYRNIDLGIYRTIRLEDNRFGFLELRPHVSYRSYWNFDGFQETGFLHVDNHWAWRKGHEVHTGVNLTREGVVDPFEIYPGVIVPPATYDHTEAQLVAFTNRAAPVSVEGRMNAGGFFGGSRVSTTATATVRVGDAFNTSVAWNRNDVDLPGGAFVANLARARVSYSFTPRIYVQGLLQYNDRDEVWSSNLRFGWLQSANTGLFVVFNDTQNLEGLSGDTPDRVVGRSVILKYSHLFDVFR